MTLRSHKDSAGNATSFLDDLTYERVLPLRRVAFVNDLFGAEAAIPTSANVGFPFIAKLVESAGTPTAARVANAIAGVVGLALDATSEKQEATLYFGDSLEFDATKNLEFEMVLAADVLPSAAAVEMVWGLQSVWIDGPDNASYYIEVQCMASGAVNVRTKDGVNTVSNSSGVTLLAAAQHVFRVDATDVTNIQFFIDGTKVSPVVPKTLMAFAATGANAVLQPYVSVYKASGTGVGTIYVDTVRVWQDRT